jgi:DNA-binding NarL/FixJ family response regulator
MASLSAVLNDPLTSPLDRLSPREIQVLKLVVEGRTSKAIARQLGVLATTIDTYRSRIMAKLGVRDVPALVRLAIRWGLIEL